MNTTFLKNIEKYFKKDKRNRIIIFEYNNKIVLSNTYSIIILYKNNLKIRDDKKINDLIEKYNVKKYDDLDYIEKYGKPLTILKYLDKLKDIDFTDKVEISNIEDKYFYFLHLKNDLIKYGIDTKFLNSINKIINNKSNIIFNNCNSDFINTNGSIGSAYVLKCISS